MYVACRALKVANRVVKAGDPVPEVETWQESIQKAHLNLEWIKWVDEPAESKPAKKKRSKDNVDRSRTRLHGGDN